MSSALEWLQAHAKADFCYLTTVGRRTGRPHTIEIWFGVEGERLFLLAGGRHASDWVRNLCVQPQVTVRIGDEARSALAAPVEPDTDDDALARRLLVGKYQSAEENLDDWGRRALPVVITFGG
jgi:deazaflavin-dependent oxidoreductase (nitroreductase family)